MARNIDREKIIYCVLFLITLVFFGILSYLFPYLGDDWAWGSVIGIRRLEAWFQNYNGRYAGNLLVLVLTRNRYLRAAVMAVSYFGACWLCSRYSGGRRIVCFLFSVVLFLCMPKEMQRETVAWTAGYANYIPSALISLFLILHGSRRILDGYQKDTRSVCASMFILAFVGGLFMEHITLFHIAWGIGLLIWEKKKYGKLFHSELWMLAGALLAAVCMFSNPVYWNALQGNNTYQRVAHTLPSMLYLIGSNGLRCLKCLIIDNGIFCCAVSGLITLFYFQRKAECPASQRALAGWSLLGHIVCLAAIILLRCLPDRRIWVIQGVFSVVYVISLFVITGICGQKAQREKLLLPLVCALVVLFPLLFVSPVGDRCCFLAYLLVMAFLSELLCCILDQWKTERKKNAVAAGVLCPIIILQMLLSFSMFYTIYQYDQKRIAFSQMQSDAGAKRIVVSELPFGEHVHMHSLKENMWHQRYKRFYGLDSEAELVMVKPEEFDRIFAEYLEHGTLSEDN